MVQPTPNHRAGRVLFVDDEPAMLSSLRRIFRKEGYEVETAPDGASGLEVFRRFRPGVVVSDHRMPGMSGVEFLAQAREIDPETVRVVLTGCTDIVSAEQAINTGEVWRFVTKPWDDVDLRDTVAAAARRYKMVSENRLMLDKLAAIGLLAGGIAHELNNPLGQILLLAGMMAQDAPAGSQLAADLAQVEAATLRAKTIVNELLDFARTKTAELGPVSLAVVAAKSIALSKFRLVDIDVRVEEEGTGRHVFGDASRLQQVVLNLLSNAVDAIAQSRKEGKESGRIVVKTWDDGTDCHLMIQDDGAGIPPEAQARIFDTFYSTKPAGPGTGLGLPVSLGIVRDHGGRLEVRSAPGQGSTFVLSVPGTGNAAA